MILIALGANLPSHIGAPPATLAAALARLEARGLKIMAASSLWQSAPVPVSDQPDYYNQVIAVETPMQPGALLRLLHEIERDFGRHRAADEPKNQPRTLDLDLLAYHDVVLTGAGLNLPHPRLQERAFVLLPLREIAPDWAHPVTGQALSSMIEALPAGQKATILTKAAA